MKPNELDALIDDCLSGQLTEADAARLSAELQRSPDARSRYWDAASIHGLLEHTLQQASIRVITGQSLPKPARWYQWRSLTAAAAGLVIGLLSASLVYGMRVAASEVKRQSISIAEPGFERMKGEVGKGFPSGAGTWTADDAEVVPGPDGGHVLSLRPSEKNPYSRVVQIVDVSGLTAEGERELVLAASFRTSDTQHASRYKLRLFGFEESADAVPPFPLETKESGIVTLSQVLDVPAGSAGWQRFSTKMPLPVGVKSVVLWIGASTRPQPGPKVTHFVDDVTLTLDVHQPAPR